MAQGYLYANTIINASGVHFGKPGFTQMKVFNNGGTLAFWWPRVSYWNSFSVNVRDAGGSEFNRVTSIGNSTEPTGTKKITITMKVSTVYNQNINTGDLYATRYYDSNSTGYYLDPASTSYLNDIRPNILYDRNDTNYYLNPNGTSRLATANITTLNTYGTTTLGNGNNDTTNINDTLKLWATDSGDSHFYFGESSSNGYGDHWYWDSGYNSYHYSRYAGTDSLISYHDTRNTSRITYGRNIVFNNYGIGIVGNYTSTRLQLVFAMGDSYKPNSAGTSTANMYGIGWSHPNAGGLGGANNLNDHGLLIINNGQFRAAISSRAVFTNEVRGTLFRDYNNSGYYADPASTSVFNIINANTFNGTFNGNASSARHLLTNYVGGQRTNPQTYFNGGIGLKVAMTGVPNVWSDTLWINGYSGGDVQNMNALHFRRNGTPRMYISTQLTTATSYGTMYQILSNYGGEGTYSTTGDFRAPIFYDTNNTGRYIDGGGTSVLQRLKLVNNVNNNPRWDFTAYVMEAQHWYGNNASQTMYLGESGNIVNVRGSLRSPRFYDYSDTGYYVDPASTSILNEIRVNEYIRHNGDTNTYLRFIAADDFQIVVGGRQLLRMDEGGDPDVVQLGDSSTRLNHEGKRTYFGLSSSWDAVGFGSMTNLHFQGHNQFWIGAGNGTWFTGTANSKSQASGLAADASQAHDLLISTMQGTSATDRGITFAVDTSGAGTGGWRLGKWHSGNGRTASLLAVDGQIFAKGGYTDEYDYYANDYSQYYNDGQAHWVGDSGQFNKPSIVASTALQIQSGNGGTNSRKPQIQFHQYGYGGPKIEYDGPADILRFQGSSSRLDWVEFNTSGVTNGLRINYDQVYSPARALQIQYSTGQNTYINAGSGGNVGIGSASAAERLHVHGNVRANIYYDNNNTGYRFDGASTSIANYFKINNLYDAQERRYTSPSGGTYTTSTSTVTGAIRIYFPANRRRSNTMLRFTVKVYEYSQGRSHTFDIGGYNYSNGDFINRSVTQMTDSGRGALTLRWGDDGSRQWVTIGESNTSWSYPQVHVTDVQVGYSGFSTNWGQDWVVNFGGYPGGLRGSRVASLVLTQNNASNYNGDLYANRFYDKGNAGYYLDPASTSYLNDVRANIYYERENTAYYFGSSQGDFRMRNGRFDSVDAYGTFDMQSGNQIRLYTSSGNIRGYIQSTESNDAHLIIATSGGEDISFRDGGLSGQWNMIIRGDGQTLINSRIDSPIYYDRNDTAYYTDPNSISRMYQQRLLYRLHIGDETNLHNAVAQETRRPDLTIKGQYPQLNLMSSEISNSNHGPTLRFVGYDGANASSGNYKHWVIGTAATNATALHFGYSPNQTNPHYGIGRGWSSGNNVSMFWLQNDRHVYAQNDVRAGIFRDRNNTGYYVDPASDSLFNTATFNGRLKFDNYIVSKDSGGMMGNYNQTGTAEKVIWTIGESWPLGNMYGIGYSYNQGGQSGHHLVFKNNGSASNRIGFAGGAYFTGTVQATGDFRSPIYYDRNNTGYYIHGDSTSNLNALNINGVPVLTGTSIQNYIRNVDNGSFYNITDDMNSAEVRTQLGSGDGRIIKVDDNTAPAAGCFEVNGGYVSVQHGDYIKIDANSQYIFEVWVKHVAGTDSDAGLYMGGSAYNASKSYFGNTNRYWGSSFERFDSNSRNDGQWYKVSGRLGGTGGQGFTAGTEYIRPLFLFNYASNSTHVSRYCGLKFYKAEQTLGRLHFHSGTRYNHLNTDQRYPWIEGDGNKQLKIQNSSGWTKIGALNTSYTYYYTDRPSNYFDKRVETGGDMRAPIFYDRNDTGYYANPASTSYFNDMRANIYYDRNSTSYYGDFASTSRFNRADLNDTRSDIFYDRNNTGYYINPASVNS